MLYSLLGYSIDALASTEAFSDGEENTVVDWRSLQVYEDVSGSLSASDVLSRLGEFEYITSIPSYGATHSHIWVYLSDDAYVDGVPLWLELGNAYIDQVNFYHLIHNQETGRLEPTLVTKTGDTRPFAARQIKHRSFIFLIPEDQTDGILIQARGQSPMLLPMILGDPVTVFERLTLYENFILFLYGVIFAMTIYNLMVYLGTRYPEYGWYIIYMVSMSTSILFNSGYGYAYIWQDMVWLQQNIGYLAYVGFTWGGLNFTRSYLSSKQHLPRFDRYFFWIAQSPLLIVPFLYVDKALTALLVTLSLLLLTISVIGVGIMSCRKKVQGSWLFVFCWVPMMASMFAYSLIVMGVLEPSYIGIRFAEIGVATESMVLSFALIYRLRQIQKTSNKEVYEAYSKVSDALKMVERSNASNEAFLLSAGHQLKTPIHVLIGNLQLLSEKAEFAEQVDIIDQTDLSATELLFKVDNLLTYSSLVSEGYRPFIQRCNVRAEIMRIQEYWKHIFANSEIKVDMRIDDSVPTILEMDWLHISKVIRNIIEAAMEILNCKQMYITFRLEYRASKPYLSADLTASNRFADEDIIDWYNSTNSDHWNGESMGALVSHMLIQEIGAQSKLSNRHSGAHLDVAFPVTEVSNQELAKEGAFKGKRILVVDDMAVNLKILSAFVKKLEATPITALSGQEALNKLSESKVDLILLDCMMPEMSGHELAQRVRANPELDSDIPIIAVSANDTDVDRLKCIQSGMNDFMAKPVRLDGLKAVLSQWLL
ncbi:hybrid sensor histidine kinase/response regulator [Reinekea thalattae]|nr:7TM diverse intracellular signaling domain-containing protein [Reinekea thalattae]